MTALITNKYKSKNLLIFEDFKKEINKTKEMYIILKKFESTDALLILDINSKKNIYRSLKNIPNVKVTDVNHFSSYDLLKYNKVIFTETSIKELEKKYE